MHFSAVHSSGSKSDSEVSRGVLLVWLDNVGRGSLSGCFSNTMLGRKHAIKADLNVEM